MDTGDFFAVISLPISWLALFIACTNRGEKIPPNVNNSMTGKPAGEEEED